MISSLILVLGYLRLTITPSPFRSPVLLWCRSRNKILSGFKSLSIIQRTIQKKQTNIHHNKFSKSTRDVCMVYICTRLRDKVSAAPPVPLVARLWIIGGLSVCKCSSPCPIV